MPYRQTSVDPEVALVYKGVTVYHTYNEGDADDQNTFWYATNADELDEDEFDVRELKAWAETEDGSDMIVRTLCHAIDTGELS